MSRENPALPGGPPEAAELNEGQCWSIVVRKGWKVRFTCLAGVLWITEAGDELDHILHPGERFVSRGRGLIVAQPLGQPPTRFPRHVRTDVDSHRVFDRHSTSLLRLDAAS